MIKKSEIIEAIHEGVFEAHGHFELLSDGDWISDPHITRTEGFLVSKIFLAISQRAGSDEKPAIEFPFEISS